MGQSYARMAAPMTNDQERGMVERQSFSGSIVFSGIMYNACFFCYLRLQKTRHLFGERG